MEFFVDLWNELQKRARSTNTDSNLAGPKSFSDVRNSTSASMGSNEDGCLFDETIASFRNRKQHAEHLLIEALQSSLPSLLRSYVNKSQWLTVLDDADEVSHSSLLPVTVELEQPLQIMRRDMKLLRDALAPSAFRRVWHEAQKVLQDLLWNEVLLRWRFTTWGAAQFQRDLTAIWAVADSFPVDESSAGAGMPKLREGARLLNLPIEGHLGSMSLIEAVDAVNAESAKANTTLAELSCQSLSLREARLVLGRRVEAAGSN